MVDFLLTPANLPFTIALIVLVALTLLEFVSLALGVGFSTLIDQALPDVGLEAPDIGVGVEAGIDSDFATDAVEAGELPAPLAALAWLGLGKVPLMVLVAIFLTSFALGGLIVQYLLLKTTDGDFLLPGYVAWVPALAIAAPAMHFLSRFIARVLPKETTESVSEKTFLGRTATIVIGTASRGNPAQAKLVDTFGRSHYVMVEPDLETETFATGSEVVLLRQESARFIAARRPE